jgi:hypothetical protein
VNVLTGYSRVGGRGMLHLLDTPGVLELGRLGLQALLDMVWVAVLVVTVLDGNYAVGVLFREHLAVLDNLHRRVVVVLVHLAVDGRLHLIALGPDHLLMLHGRLDDLVVRSARVQKRALLWGSHLVHGGIMPPIPGEEVGKRFLCLIHVGGKLDISGSLFFGILGLCGIGYVSMGHGQARKSRQSGSA